jgi:hypothetical protein
MSENMGSGAPSAASERTDDQNVARTELEKMQRFFSGQPSTVLLESLVVRLEALEQAFAKHFEVDG